VAREQAARADAVAEAAAAAERLVQPIEVEAPEPSSPPRARR